MITKGLLKELQERSNVVNITINFSAQTSSLQTQEIIESKLEKKRRTILGIIASYLNKWVMHAAHNIILHTLLHI